jgi:hypothetical protein
MESGSKRLHQKAGARFTWSDGLILLAAAALGVVLLATGRVAPNGQFIVFWALLVCAAVLIGVKHILASMRRPLVAFAWCLLGGILGGALSRFLAWSFVTTHPVRSHGEDYGAMAAGLLYVILVLLSPIPGFLTGFPVALAICAWFQSKGTGPKPSEKQSNLE